MQNDDATVMSLADETLEVTVLAPANSGLALEQVDSADVRSLSMPHHCLTCVLRPSHLGSDPAAGFCDREGGCDTVHNQTAALYCLPVAAYVCGAPVCVLRCYPPLWLCPLHTVVSQTISGDTELHLRLHLCCRAVSQ